MEKIELFVQGEGTKDVIMIEVPANMMLKEVIKVAQREGWSCPDAEEEATVFLEDEDSPVDLEKLLDEAKIHHRHHIHINRCHKIETTVNFNGNAVKHSFSPAAKINRVKKWATGPHGFNMSELDASEHTLQICNTTERPDDDAHIGTLVTFPNCTVCFDLVPKKRVEG